jgi:hypothetical protein
MRSSGPDHLNRGSQLFRREEGRDVLQIHQTGSVYGAPRMKEVEPNQVWDDIEWEA